MYLFNCPKRIFLSCSESLNRGKEYVASKFEDGACLDYYINKRKILHGVLVGTVLTIALGILFGSAGVGTCLLFSLANYVVLTGLVELKGPSPSSSENCKEATIFTIMAGIAFTVTVLFLRLVCAPTLGWLNAIPMALGVFGGHLARVTFAQEDYEIL